jgi:hypothetical protein
LQDFYFSHSTFIVAPVIRKRIFLIEGRNLRLIIDWLIVTVGLKGRSRKRCPFRAIAPSEQGWEYLEVQSRYYLVAIAPDHDINPKDEHGYYGRGFARSRMGDNQGGLEDLNQAATLCSEHRNTALLQRVQETIATL